MGMFDHFKIELPLPELPQAILNRYKLKDNLSSEVIFQTKDTPNQAMSLYNVDSTGQLLVEKIEGYWEYPKTEELETSLSLWNKLGNYIETSRCWEKVDFTGSITFYESYHHQDYSTELYDKENSYLRYEYGMIDYQVQLVNGKVRGDVILINHTLPVKHTDEEVNALAEKRFIERVKREERFKEQRKSLPSDSQKLIDTIYNLVSITSTKDATSEKIVELIKEYRKKFDTWYTDEN